jgi:hypothetical protein
LVDVLQEVGLEEAELLAQVLKRFLCEILFWSLPPKNGAKIGDCRITSKNFTIIMWATAEANKVP